MPMFNMLYLLQLILALDRLIVVIKSIKNPVANANVQSKRERYFFNVFFAKKIVKIAL